MKISEWEEAKKWLVRPKAKEEDILRYMENENYLFANGAKPKADNPYYKRHLAAEAPHATEEERTLSFEEIEDIKKQLKVSPMVKKPKKKIIKKTLIVEKPKPKPPILNLLEFEDWLNEIDPNYIEKPEDEVLLLVPKSNAAGIQKILNLHTKKFVG